MSDPTPRTDPPQIVAPVYIMIYDDGNKEISSIDGQIRVAHASLDRAWKLYANKVREHHAAQQDEAA